MFNSAFLCLWLRAIKICYVPDLSYILQLFSSFSLAFNKPQNTLLFFNSQFKNNIRNKLITWTGHGPWSLSERSGFDPWVGKTPPQPPEKGMATHSSIIAWRIPWTEEPGSLQSMGSQRVRHDWATFTSLHLFLKPGGLTYLVLLTLFKYMSIVYSLFCMNEFFLIKKILKKRFIWISCGLNHNIVKQL